MGMKVTPEEFTKEFLTEFAARAMRYALDEDRKKSLRKFRDGDESRSTTKRTRSRGKK